MQLVKNFVYFLGIVFLLSSCETDYDTPRDVVEAMQNNWEGQWYKSLAYDQEIAFYQADSVLKKANWKQLIHFPNYMHVRYEDFSSVNGSIYRNDSVYDFQNGERIRGRAFVHYILLLTSEIYFADVKETLYKLKDFQVDLTRMHETTWNNREIIIMGVDEVSNSNASQVWIDKEHLYVVRTIFNVNNSIQDTEFLDYQLVENHWVPQKLIFKSNGMKVVEMTKKNIHFPSSIDESYFALHNFSQVSWK